MKRFVFATDLLVMILLTLSLAGVASASSTSDSKNWENLPPAPPPPGDTLPMGFVSSDGEYPPPTPNSNGMLQLSVMLNLLLLGAVGGVVLSVAKRGRVATSKVSSPKSEGEIISPSQEGRR
jgi:hypothetical protein